MHSDNMVHELLCFIIDLSSEVAETTFHVLIQVLGELIELIKIDKTNCKPGLLYTIFVNVHVDRNRHKK